MSTPSCKSKEQKEPGGQPKPPSVDPPKEGIGVNYGEKAGNGQAFPLGAAELSKEADLWVNALGQRELEDAPISRVILRDNRVHHKPHLGGMFRIGIRIVLPVENRQNSTSVRQPAIARRSQSDCHKLLFEFRNNRGLGHSQAVCLRDANAISSMRFQFSILTLVCAAAIAGVVAVCGYVPACEEVQLDSTGQAVSCSDIDH
jgi:hypothetical protein